MADAARIAVIDDDAEMLRVVARFLQRNECEVEVFTDPRRAISALAERRFGVVISDVQMPGMNGLEVLERVREIHPGTIVIMITGFGSVQSAVDAMKKGAFDYISKPFVLEEFLVVVRKALRQYALERELAELRTLVRARHGYGDMIGKHASMRALFQVIDRVAPTRTPVLIEGESGTGKELVARAIHRSSTRADGPFIALNCGAMPEQLLESELFGHEKGAYTGAVSRSDGLIVSADHGTLFLDEVIDMPMSMQTKLLRVLEDWEVRAVGGSTSRRIDVRVLSASKVDLAAAAQEGRFREDLLYRLNVVTIALPPLRERREDIPLLIDHFLRTLPNEQKGRAMTVDADAMDLLSRYAWPGNIRELEHVVERAAILAQNNVIAPADLPRAVTDFSAGLAFDGGGGAFLPRTLAELERDYIMQVLKHADGRRSIAADILGINRRTLYRKLQEFGLADQEEEP
jgi:DNA-binding NtrC family response regulator